MNVSTLTINLHKSGILKERKAWINCENCVKWFLVCYICQEAYIFSPIGLSEDFFKQNKHDIWWKAV